MVTAYAMQTAFVLATTQPMVIGRAARATAASRAGMECNVTASALAGSATLAAVMVRVAADAPVPAPVAVKIYGLVHWIAVAVPLGNSVPTANSAALLTRMESFVVITVPAVTEEPEQVSARATPDSPPTK